MDSNRHRPRRGSDPDKGRLFLESPHATALAWRGTARFRTGIPGWREDYDEAMAIAEQSDTLAKSTIITYKYAGIPRGVFLADDHVLREIESALNEVERSSDDMAVVLLRLTFAMALIHHGADPGRGFDDLRALRETCIKERFALNMLPLMDIYLTLERAQQGDIDGAVEQWWAIVARWTGAGQLSNIDVPLVFTAEQLLSRGDFDGAARAIDRLRSWRPIGNGARARSPRCGCAPGWLPRGREAGYRELETGTARRPTHWALRAISRGPPRCPNSPAPPSRRCAHRCPTRRRRGVIRSRTT